VRSVCLRASACPVCVLCVPAPPGVFEPVPVAPTQLPRGPGIHTLNTLQYVRGVLLRGFGVGGIFTRERPVTVQLHRMSLLS